MTEKDSVIIYSGGLDSTTLLYEERERVALAVTFDYGSNHSKKEIAFAKWHCKKLGVEHIVIRLDFIKKIFHSSLLQGGEAIPEGRYDEDNMRSTVVPFRNGIMLSAAVGLADDRGCDYVMLANHAGDHAIYPDCRDEFIDAMNEAAQAGTYNKVRIFAPYTDITKANIVSRGAKLGVDYSKTWSCYKGKRYHCGKCGTCTERIEAFELAGVKDPTIYK